MSLSLVAWHLGARPNPDAIVRITIPIGAHVHRLDANTVIRQLFCPQGSDPDSVIVVAIASCLLFRLDIQRPNPDAVVKRKGRAGLRRAATTAASDGLGGWWCDARCILLDSDCLPGLFVLVVRHPRASPTGSFDLDSRGPVPDLALHGGVVSALEKVFRNWHRAIPRFFLTLTGTGRTSGLWRALLFPVLVTNDPLLGRGPHWPDGGGGSTRRTVRGRWR